MSDPDVPKHGAPGAPGDASDGEGLNPDAPSDGTPNEPPTSDAPDAPKGGSPDASPDGAFAGTEAGATTERVVVALVASGGTREEFKGMVSVTVPKDRLVPSVRAAKDAGFVQLSDIFGIDYLAYPGHRGKRFTVAYNLYHLDARERLFVRVDLDEGESLPTVTDLWRGASFMEREVYDMFGVEFEGHPDLRKLLTPEDLIGHPHRKDFPIGETPTLFGDGRFLDPPTFRAGLMGMDSGLTGWKGGSRKGVRSEQGREIVAFESTGEGGEK